MKVFISWSGELSRQIAQAIREWLPSILQTVKPYFTPDDLEKGTRWSTEISHELGNSNIGLICITPQNLNAPWIAFEAGALSKQLQTSRVCPLLFGLAPTDIKGPLAQFQSTPFTKAEFKKLVVVVNDINAENSLDAKILDATFEVWWPLLEERINAILTDSRPTKGKSVRSERDLLEEILSDVRAIKQTLPQEQVARPKEQDQATGQPAFTPLYEQIRLLILRSIQNGEFMSGESLPAEMDLASRYRVSQGTVRKAIDSLISDRIVERTRSGDNLGSSTVVL